MADPGRYKPQSLAANNQMLREISKSFQHLHMRQPPNNINSQQEVSNNNNPTLQSQMSFEQQLSLAGNINALAQSAAGDRRSYPREVPRSTNHAHALEEIRRDLQHVAFRKESRNGTLISSTPVNGYPIKSNKLQYIKSSSVTDLHQVIRDSQMAVDQQQKLAVLVSYGYDEVKYKNM